MRECLLCDDADMGLVENVVQISAAFPALFSDSA